MEKKKIFQFKSLLIIIFFAFEFLHIQNANAVEPVIADYTSYPIFQTNAVAPNILIILDNSGSMNFNAYGTYVADNAEVLEPFNGAPPFCNTRESKIIQAADNVETFADPAVSTDISTSDDELDIGNFNDGGQSIVALRFQDIKVPQGRTITNAYIQFTSHNSHTGSYNNPITVKIRARAGDSPGDFNGASQNDVINMPLSAASVDWNIPAWTVDFQKDDLTKTPNISSVVQEIVDRSGWQSGNSMVFAISEGTGDGFREICSYNMSSGTYVPVLHIEFDPVTEDCTKYYGYFDPDSKYKWDTNRFVRDAAGQWDGNWMNWCTMRRIDVLRKVLMGGLATARSGGGNQVNYGETPNQTTRVFKRHFIGTGFTPDPSSNGGNYWYTLKGGYMYMDADSNLGNGYIARYDVKIQKDATHPNEERDFLDGNLAGVLQKVGNKARWGNEWFYEGTGANKSGGFIESRIGTNMTTLITTLQNTGCDTWTPLAESYYVAMQYFKQQACDTSLDFKSNASGALNATNDPYYDNGYVACAKSFVILLTDGASTKDGKIPSALKDYDGDGNDNTACNESTGSNCDYPEGGTDFLDDMALFARTNDLRADLDGTQNMILYAIYAFGSDENARSLLQDAAKNGGFIDRNDNKLPDLDPEWDKDGNGIPDTYFEAQDGYQLERELLNAINDILKRAASGTAVSVLATKGEGEGTVVQAYFKPSLTSGFEDIKWVGYLQSIWVDRYGNTREDTNGNKKLDIGEDNIITFYLDVETGETKVKRFDVTPANPYPGTDNASEILTLEEIIPIWEAGDKLADTPAANRHIFTYVGDGTEPDPNVNFIEFKTSNASLIGKFMGLEDTATWGYLGQTDNTTRVNNLIHFIRGIDDNSADYQGSPSIGSRTMEDGRLWKLSDIVHSTPVSISKPVENYGLLYDDLTYQDFFLQYKNRETVVYVGGNDGMLHAFTSGVYDSDNHTFKKISEVAGYMANIPDSLGIGDIQTGDELWAYIPQNLLPHLRWLPYEGYTHVAYVDLQPKVVDAKIFSDSATHPNGWGTLLIGGMRMGGKNITAGGKTYSPGFFALDITNPRNPSLLWEKSYPNLAFAMNIPSVVKVKDKWFLAIGSGPDSYNGSSSQNGHVYIVDLLTGLMLRDYVTSDTKAYMNTPVSFDKGMNYSVDGIYIGASYLQGTAWKGRMYKIAIPQQGAEFDPGSTDYKDNPADWDSMVKLFDSPRPFTAPFTLSIDSMDNCWVFAGTGRYIEDADKTTTTQDYIFGIKDPFFNPDDTACFGKYGLECQLDINDLFDANIFTIKMGGIVQGDPGITNFTELIEEARKDIYDGWFRKLCPNYLGSDGSCLGAGPSERVLSKPSILGGILLVPTFAPNSDICGFGGMGRLFAIYYETGTAYKRRILGEEPQDTILDVIALGEGLSSSFGIHVGKEEGATLYGQLSTGVIKQIQVNVSGHTSTPIYWREE